MLGTLHNLRYYQRLMARDARRRSPQGTFAAFRESFYAARAGARPAAERVG